MEFCGNGVVCRSVVLIGKLVRVQGGCSMLEINTLMSFSNHLLTMGVRAMGIGHVALPFFGTGMMTDEVGTMPVKRERLKMFVNTPASWSAHALSTRPGIPSDLAASRMLMRLNTTHTSFSVMTRALAVFSVEEVLSRRLVCLS